MCKDCRGLRDQDKYRFLRQAQDRLFNCAVRKVRELPFGSLRIRMHFLREFIY